MQRSLRYIVAFALLIALAAGLLYDVTWHPAKHEELSVTCNAKDVPPPLLAPGQTLKVMTWNIQHLAGNAMCSGTTWPTAAARTNARLPKTSPITWMR